MASRERRKPSSRSSRNKNGSTLFGLMLGLILGLAVAAVVAWFVTQKSMPFADKASRTRPQTLLPDVRHAPDPNVGLAGGNRGAGSVSVSGSGFSDMTVPGAGSGVSVTRRPSARPPSNLPGQGQQADDIAALLATLDSAQSSSNTSPGTPTTPLIANVSPNPANTTRQPSTIYFLQAGAFRSENDAQSTRARVLMLGLPAQVQAAQLDGAPLYRVRVGPFRGIDEMNRSREQLSRAQIESSIVRP